MWATSFSDLAKKAQEASEKASSSMNSMNLSDPSKISSIFNLDSMLDKGSSNDTGDDTTTTDDNTTPSADDAADANDDDTNVNTGTSTNTNADTSTDESAISTTLSKISSVEQLGSTDAGNTNTNTNTNDILLSSVKEEQEEDNIVTSSPTSNNNGISDETTTTDNNNNQQTIDASSTADTTTALDDIVVSPIPKSNTNGHSYANGHRHGHVNGDSHGAGNDNINNSSHSLSNVSVITDKEDNVSDDDAADVVDDEAEAEKKEQLKKDEHNLIIGDEASDNENDNKNDPDGTSIELKKDLSEEKEDVHHADADADPNNASAENSKDVSPTTDTTQVEEEEPVTETTYNGDSNVDNNEQEFESGDKVENRREILTPDKNIKNQDDTFHEENIQNYTTDLSNHEEVNVSTPVSTPAPVPVPEHSKSDELNESMEQETHDVTFNNVPSPDRSFNSLVSPLSKKDERSMCHSMSKSVENCDSEKDFDIDDFDENINDADDINGMYDDDDDDNDDINGGMNDSISGDNENISDKSINVKEDIDESNITPDSPSKNTPPQETETETTGTNPATHVPQFAIEKFMSQLERLHEQHEGELQEMERKHQGHIGDLKEKLESATSRQKEQNAKSGVADNDKFLAQLRKLEKDFNGKLKKKDEQIADLVEINKLMEEQIEELKCEADGLNKSLEARNEMLSEAKEKETQIETLKTSLKDSQSELESSNEAFATLKGRVKVVATELKDRRVECRTLNLSVQELTLAKSNLEIDNKDMSSKLSRLEKLSDGRGGEIESLQKSVADLRQKLSVKEKEMVEKGSVGDKALNSYKKKAQNLLASANARAAAANQAREDSEIDAINARVEAEKILNEARDSEKERQKIVSSSLKEVQNLQKHVDEVNREKDRIAIELETAQSECLKAFDEVKESQIGRECLLNELNNKDEELEREIEKNSGLNQDMAMSRIKNKDLEDEVVALKRELEKAASVAFMARQKEAETQNNVSNATFGSGINQPNEQNDATIVMLQQELEVANDVIRDLKDSLGAILSKDPSKVETQELIETVNSFTEGNTSGANEIDNGNDSTPLFFAFEKQAELNTARDEITRMAALLGDAESEKMEAYDAKETMRIKMEEAESRLRRFEKLGAAAGGNRSVNGSSYNNAHGRRSIGSSHYSSHQVGGSSVTAHSDSSVNLEYLKNIMLRYMHAMSLNEKKALIPVIGAVLELTADEQTQAMEHIEKSSGIQGVGTSLIENVQNKGFVSGLFGDLI